MEANKQDVMVNEFMIKVMKSEIEKALAQRGFKANESNVNKVIGSGMIEEIESILEMQFTPYLLRGFIENDGDTLELEKNE
jgi:hypothetical protein